MQSSPLDIYKLKYEDIQLQVIRRKRKMTWNRVKAGLKARETNKKRYGDDYYIKMGRVGGKSGKADGTIKGFATNRERARSAGAKGGRISRRGKTK